MNKHEEKIQKLLKIYNETKNKLWEGCASFNTLSGVTYIKIKNEFCYELGDIVTVKSYKGYFSFILYELTKKSKVNSNWKGFPYWELEKSFPEMQLETLTNKEILKLIEQHTKVYSLSNFQSEFELYQDSLENDCIVAAGSREFCDKIPELFEKLVELYQFKTDNLDPVKLYEVFNGSDIQAAAEFVIYKTQANYNKKLPKWLEKELLYFKNNELS